jgi:hypothetical protein
MGVAAGQGRGTLEIMQALVQDDPNPSFFELRRCAAARAATKGRRACEGPGPAESCLVGPAVALGVARAACGSAVARRGRCVAVLCPAVVPCQ